MTVEFFDRAWTAEELQLHSGNEFAVHRWDMVGDDALGEQFMSSRYVTQSAIKTLNLLPVLDETPTARARRHGLADICIVLRCPDQPDVAFIADTVSNAHLKMADEGQTLTGDVIVQTDATNRLLTLWGRRSSARAVSINGDPLLWPVVAATLWEGQCAWPPRVDA